MKTTLLQGETIIKWGGANLQRGAETVGGHLYLTNLRLIFEPHGFNFQRGVTILDLNSIADITKAWTKFLNIFPIFPNTMNVKIKDGNECNFAVFSRDSWINTINSSRCN